MVERRLSNRTQTPQGKREKRNSEIELCERGRNFFAEIQEQTPKFFSENEDFGEF